MSTFMFICIAVTCVFVTIVLVVDHIEVNRSYRLRHPKPSQSFLSYLEEIGVPEDGPIEDLVEAHKNYERIQKIMRTM